MVEEEVPWLSVPALVVLAPPNYVGAVSRHVVFAAS